MDSGIPTMLLLKEDLWNLSFSGKKIYDTLKKHEIIFTDPNLMIKHLVRIHKDPQLWWNTKKILEVRNLFNVYFMKNGDFSNWCKFFKSLR